MEQKRTIEINVDGKGWETLDDQPRVEQPTVDGSAKPEALLKVSRVNFPDVIFPDGRVMVYNEILEKYIIAPDGYKRMDVAPFPVGDIHVMPYFEPSPSDDDLRRRKESMMLDWLQFASWVGRIGIVCFLALILFWGGGYVFQVIRVFGTTGAPKIAEMTGVAIGNILSIALYIVSALAGGLFLLSILGAFRKGGTAQPEFADAYNRNDPTNQNININIGRDFNGGSDPAQQILNGR